MNKATQILFAFIALFLAAPTVSAIPEEEKDSIVFSANSMSGSTSENNEYTRLKGNAKIKTKTMEIKADSIQLSGTDYRNIRAEGDIEGTDKEGGFTFTCNSLRYDRETKITVLEGSVAMYDTENNVQVKAEYIEYNQNTETALIQINVEITREKSVCTSAFAIYHKKIQILELNGSPKVAENNNVFRAQEIVFNLDTKEITLDGKVSGTVTDKNESGKAANAESNTDE